MVAREEQEEVEAALATGPAGSSEKMSQERQWM